MPMTAASAYSKHSNLSNAKAMRARIHRREDFRRTITEGPVATSLAYRFSLARFINDRASRVRPSVAAVDLVPYQGSDNIRQDIRVERFSAGAITSYVTARSAPHCRRFRQADTKVELRRMAASLAIAISRSSCSNSSISRDVFYKCHHRSNKSDPRVVGARAASSISTTASARARGSRESTNIRRGAQIVGEILSGLQPSGRPGKPSILEEAKMFTELCHLDAPQHIL